MVRRAPDAPAVEDPRRVVSYRELAARVAAISGWLRAQGAGPEHTVAVLAEPTTGLPSCVLAAWQTGAAYLALDPQTPRARLQSILDRVRPVAIVTEGTLRSRVAGSGLPLLAVDRDLPPGATAGGLAEPAPVDPDNLAYLIHTSGSTGEPKSVGVSQRALLAIVDDWTRLYGLGDEVTSVFQAAGLGFDVATGNVARALLTGCRLVMCPRETLLSLPELHAYLRRTRPQLAEVTPSLLRPLVRYLAGIDGRLDFVRCLVAGGENWTAADQRAARAIAGRRTRIFNTYGLTEAAIDSTYHETDGRSYARTGVPIGRPFAGTEVHVLDAELRPAAQGQLYVAGTQLARGYFADPGTTAQRFVPAPSGPPGARAYRTGDRVRQLPDGELLYLGRADDQVKVRGVRIHLLEVETALAAHPGVLAAVAIPCDLAADGVSRTELAAYVVPAGDGLDVEDVRRHAARRLPPAMVPAFVTVVGRLPVTVNGKVNRELLPPPTAVSGRTGTPSGCSAGDDPAEAAVTEIWRRVLGQPVLGVHAHFFDLGGNSLLAAQVITLIQAELGAEVPLGALLDHPTVAELAALVRRAAAREPIPADPHRTEGPLAPAQSRLWLLDRMTNGLADHNIPAVISITGPLDVAALRAALRLLVDRHAALRTAFVLTPHGPVQQVSPVPDRDLLEVHGPGVDDPAEWIQRYARHPIDLTAPPLLRAALLANGPRQTLVLVLHHLVSDGWTLRVLLRDLGRIYSALVARADTARPPAPISYLDYAAWQTSRLARGDFAGQLTYWRNRLASLPPAAELPRPATSGPDGQRAPDGPARLAAGLGQELTDAVRGLAGELRTTTFTLLLTAFMTMLRRWSGTEDLVVGVPFGDRTAPHTEELAGFFVNTVPLRVQVAADSAFSEAVRLTRAAVADAARAQDLPFDLVQRELRRSGKSAPFRAWFNFLGPPDEPPDMAGLRTEMLPPPVTGALFDLNAYVTDHPDELQIELIFDPGRCDTAHMSAFLAQLAQLLRRVTADPEAPLAGHQLEADHPATQPAAGPGQPEQFPSLPAAVAAVTRSRPGAAALRGDGRAITYGELACWAGGLAARLTAHGLGPDDVVAVYGHRDASLVAALLGVLAAGAAFTVLDPAYPPARLAAQLQETRPAALARLTSAGPPPAGISSLAPIVLDVRPASEPGPPLRGDARHALAYVAFTSGTTGRPRPVYGDQPPVAHFLRVYARRFAVGPSDRFAMLAGLAHDPLLRDVFTPLCVGGTLCIPPPGLVRTPRELLGWLGAERVTVAHLTPALVRLLAGQAGTDDRIQLPGLRLALCGGDQLRWADVTALRGLAPGVTVVNGYGTTETPQVASWYVIPPGQPVGPAELAVPIGQGIDDVGLLVQTAAGQPAAAGEIGRIVVRTPYLTRDLRGSYDTGDLGRRQPDGAVVLVGRADDQVVVNGHRIEPAEIDLRAVRLPYVRDCVTRVRRSAAGESRLVSYVVPVGPEPVTLAELRAGLRSNLPDHLLPSGLVLLEKLPVTPNGKVDAAALAAWPGEQPVPAGDVVPRTLLERDIAQVWRQALGLHVVPIDVSFFDLGGTSLLVAQVQGQLERRLRRGVPIVALFAYPTVRTLAAHLSGIGSRHGSRDRRLVVVPADAPYRRAVRRQLRDQVGATHGRDEEDQ
jgi:amino acid adenylation domain-containing protein